MAGSFLGGALGGFTGSALGRVLVEVGLDLRPMEQGFKQAEGQAKASGSAIGGTLKTALAAGAIVAGAAIVKFGATSVKAFEEAEASSIRLQNTLANNPRLSDVATESWDKQSHAIQELTGVQDEFTRGAQAVLGQFHLTGTEVQRLIPLVVDLSQKMGIDMEAAAKAVGKATQGNTGILQRYGIQVQKSADGTVKLADVINGLGVVQGFAEAKGKTFAGQLDILRSNFKDIQEQVGKTIVQVAQHLVPVLEKLLPVISFAGKNAGALLIALAAFATLKFLPPLLLNIGVGLERIGAKGLATGIGNAAGAIQGMGVAAKLAVTAGVALLAEEIMHLGSAAADQKRNIDQFTQALDSGTYTVGALRAAIDQLVSDNKLPQWAGTQLYDAVTKASGAVKENTRVTHAAKAAMDQAAGAAGQETMSQTQLAAAHQRAADAAKAQKAAEQALVGGILGLIGSLKTLRDDQAKVNEMQKHGKQGTQAYKDAVLTVLSDQLSFNQALKDYGDNLRKSGDTQAQVKAKLEALGAQAGVAKQQVDAIAASVFDLTKKLDGLPSTKKITVTLDLSQFIQQYGLARARLLALNNVNVVTGGGGSVAPPPPPPGHGGPNMPSQNINIHVNGAQDPASTAREVVRQLQKLQAGSSRPLIGEPV